ncbi:protein qui-1 isoform X1 [Anopheles funestus]|uniref:protein qui-1 isoform X1 n=1 Tax=Anopheles funestus TaxID=62324 RepID=UPI0020C647E7|nr:protein qui-1 isoform X1 [Anopheles funestus]XP_049297952.1 protein qui-1 isoform X1 [Anopheles funestus]XP_049297953.1 protein qui-1 isoform X1 [Anopheles funestus]
MAAAIEEAVFNALRGHHNAHTKLPSPRIIKIYVASLKDDFKEERRLLLEVIGPDLQTLYDDRQLEIEIVDIHFGTGSDGFTTVELDPYVLEDHLEEIETCHAVSKSVFLIVLLGSRLGNFLLPTKLDPTIFTAISKLSTGDEVECLRKWYSTRGQQTGIHPVDERLANGEGCYYWLATDYRTLDRAEWVKEAERLRELLERRLEEVLRLAAGKEKSSEDGLDGEQFCDNLKRLKTRAIAREIEKGLACSPGRILTLFRQWQKQPENGSTEHGDDGPPGTAECTDVEQLVSSLVQALPASNHQTLTVDWAENGIDPELECHDLYLSGFKNKMFEMMKASIDQDLAKDPNGGKGRKKTVQEIFHEHSTHLMYLNEHLSANKYISSKVPERIRQNVQMNFRSGSRHPPYFIHGGHGTGKSTLLSHIYTELTGWFEHVKVHRIIRYAAATPRSAYNLELLRVVCQQLAIILNIPEGYLPKDASFDPLYINNWFQNLLKHCEDLHNEILFLFIDDLHRLNPLDCDIVAALSWLPISLPWNVFLVVSTTVPIESLRLTPMQKERFKCAEYFFDLALEQNETKVLRWGGNLSAPEEPEHDVPTFVQLVNGLFDAMEQRFGVKGFSRLAIYITCSEYGLTETELLELLMPTQDAELVIDSHEGDFNFSTFRTIRNQMRLILREKLMSGKLLIVWRHSICSEITRARYMTPDITRSIHSELVNLFFPPDGDDSEDMSTEQHSRKSSMQTQQDDNVTQVLNLGPDISYSIRHVEEAWHHLIKSEDTKKLKEIAVCNFDFLLAAVQTVSISYLRCLIEHVRCYILDRDIELVYYTIRKSSDVLTRDPMQLGAQLISWLKSVSAHEGPQALLSVTVQSATAWCDGYTVPLLVPLTGWLPVPLPSQIRCITVPGPGPVRCIEVSPSKQHLILSPKVGDPQLWHIMSNSLVHTFKGHSGPVTYMKVLSQYLVTTSEDTSVIVWDMKTLAMKLRLREHIAPALCATLALDNKYVISGSDDSSIIIALFETGKVVTKIDHHRGPVTALHMSYPSEVLVSSSHDATVCLWSLVNFTLLNCIQMAQPILGMQISCDSTFLLVHCADNGLYLRSLTTGTELHALKGHKSKVRALCIAMDSQRAIVGGEDTRALIFDMHSGRIIRSLPPNPGAVTAVYVMEKDDYLITAGGNKITFYSFRNEDSIVNFYPKKKKTLKKFHRNRLALQSTSSPVICFDVSRDSTMAAVASSRCVQIWQLNSPELTSILEGHTATVTCVSFAPNCELVASGSEDKTVNVWSLGLGSVTATFKGHNTSITSVTFMMDARRIISADRDGFLYVWISDSGMILQNVQGPHKCLSVTNNMKFAVCTNGDSSLRIWSLTREDEKYTVSHSDEITCFIITADSLYVITGSRDMSLKVWQATGGKLAQVLVGHTDAVTCVAVSVTNKSQVISGSKDSNLIIWDIHTGEEIHTLAGHLGPVTCVKVSADGTTAVSGSDDKTLIVWETKRGLALTSLQLHVQFTRFDISLECSRIIVQLVDSSCLPIICLHNSPASYIKLPTYSAPARDVEDLRPAGPKRPARRLLKKEVSLDTYTWQKKYAHLTSSVMMAQVDERLKRRFSVSASMEEISKLAEAKNVESQATLGPEQAALAQSQHFDQLEALWNKRSPPRRRLNASLSRQSSLVEDRIDSSDEDEFQEERAGMSKKLALFHASRPLSLSVDAWNCSSLYSSTSSTNTQYNQPNHHQQHQYHQYHHRHQPDLLREVLLLKKQHSVPTGGHAVDPFAAQLKLSSTETDLQALFRHCTFGTLSCHSRRRQSSPESEQYHVRTRRKSRSIDNLDHEVTVFRQPCRRNPMSRSCLMQ